MHHRFSCLALLLPCFDEIAFIINKTAFMSDEVAKFSYGVQILFCNCTALIMDEIARFVTKWLSCSIKLLWFSIKWFSFSIKLVLLLVLKSHHEVNQLSNRPNEVL